MPAIYKIKKASALRSRRGPSLEDLVFRMGGVAGAVRRIVHRSPRPLTMNQIHARIQQQHPALRPARSQVEDTIQDLVAHGRVEFKHNASNVRVHYWRTAPAPAGAPMVRVKSVNPKQLVFEVF